MPRKPTAQPSPQPPARTVRCPTCGGPSLYSPANRWRPFCSERCKLQDLGAWASEQFRVEVHEQDGSAADASPVTGNGGAGPLVH